MPEQTLPDGYKQCSACREIKICEEFHRCQSKWDGLQASCKDCQRRRGRTADTKQRKRKWEAKNRERLNAKAAEWRNANPGRVASKQKRWAKRHPEGTRAKARRARNRWPEKTQARMAVGAALANGGLSRPNLCQVCGTKGQPFEDGRARIQAHHEDYSKPLEVEWLCQSCHTRRHHPD